MSAGPLAGITPLELELQSLRSHLMCVLGNTPVLLATESPFRAHYHSRVFSLAIICPLQWLELPQGQKMLILFA